MKNKVEVTLVGKTKGMELLNATLERTIELMEKIVELKKEMGMGWGDHYGHYIQPKLVNIEDVTDKVKGTHMEKAPDLFTKWHKFKELLDKDTLDELPVDSSWVEKIKVAFDEVEHEIFATMAQPVGAKDEPKIAVKEDRHGMDLTGNWCIRCKCCHDENVPGQYMFHATCSKANGRTIRKGVPYIGSMTGVRPDWCPGFVPMDGECDCEDMVDPIRVIKSLQKNAPPGIIIVTKGKEPWTRDDQK